MEDHGLLKEKAGTKHETRPLTRDTRRRGRKRHGLFELTLVVSCRVSPTRGPGFPKEEGMNLLVSVLRRGTLQQGDDRHCSPNDTAEGHT